MEKTSVVAALLLNLAATWYMTGVIWFVQVVHYPLFARVSTEQFATYERLHQDFTFWVVFPPMMVELASSLWLVFSRPRWMSDKAAWLGLSMLVLIWLSTFLVQVPYHQKLSGGFDATTQTWLVGTNWGRTFLWSLRSGLLLWIVSRGLAQPGWISAESSSPAQTGGP